MRTTPADGDAAAAPPYLCCGASNEEKAGAENLITIYPSADQAADRELQAEADPETIFRGLFVWLQK